MYVKATYKETGPCHQNTRQLLLSAGGQLTFLGCAIMLRKPYGHDLIK